MSHLNKKKFLEKFGPVTTSKKKQPKRYHCEWCGGPHLIRDCPYKARGIRATVGADGVVDIDS